MVAAHPNPAAQSGDAPAAPLCHSATSPLCHSPPPLSPEDGQRLAALFQTARSPFKLAEKTNTPLHEILDWLARPHIQEHIERITALETSAHRAAAIALLRDLAEKTDDNVEKRRAACAILRATSPPRPPAILRAASGAAPSRSAPSSAPPAKPPPPSPDDPAPHAPSPLPFVPPRAHFRKHWPHGPYHPTAEDVRRYIVSSPDNVLHWVAASISSMHARDPDAVFSAIYNAVQHEIMCGGKARSDFMQQLAASPFIVNGALAIQPAPAVINGDTATSRITLTHHAASPPNNAPRHCTLHLQYRPPFSNRPKAWVLTAITPDSS